MCSVARSEACKRDWKHPIYPNYQRWMVARSITLKQAILVEKMKYQSYNIKARVCLWIKNQSRTEYVNEMVCTTFMVC